MKKNIYHDVAAEFTAEGKLQPKKVQWEEQSLYDIGEVRAIPKYLPDRQADIGPCMDICVHEGYLYVIQRTDQYPGGRLCVLDSEMKMVGEYVGIGNARQIEITGEVAVITAREDGLWVFDISKKPPVLLAHYQTIEFATGVTLYANFALVSCRQYGVEIVDLSAPEKPVHVGIIRVGEVQSACVYEGYLYCGVWGAMSVIVVDIRDITKPVVISRIPLEGRGDGVLVWEGRLYAVTGQHRRGIQNVSDKLDPSFGQGNGLAVFDVADPMQPKVLHQEFFGECYNISFDMWKPALCEGVVLSGCSSLGVFACDREHFEPRFRIVLPPPPEVDAEKIAEWSEVQAINVAFQHDAVTSFATMGRTVYLCGAHTDLYAFDTGEMLGVCKRWDVPKHIKVVKQPLHVCSEDTLAVYQRYDVEGTPVLGLCDCGDRIAVACGSDGVRLLDKETYAEMTHLAAEGCCYDVKYADGYLVAAMSEGGILICRKEKDSLCVASLIQTEMPVQQLCLSADGRFLWCGYGSSACRLYDITDKEHPKLIGERKAAQGPLYGDNFAGGRLEDGTMLMFWHRDGLVYVNPSSGDTQIQSIFYRRTSGIMQLGPENGCDTDGTRIFYNLNGGYVFLPIKENVNADDLPVYRTEVPIEGKITLCGDYLVAAERARGIITVTDVSNVKEPIHLGTAIVNASPGKPVYIDGKILIPGGHEGLLEVMIFDKMKMNRLH